MKIIPLTETDLNICRTLATKRNTKKGNIRSARVNQKASDYGIHFMGLLGELAFSKYMQIPLDTTHNSIGGDSGFDFRINNKTFDIKYSKSKSNCLLFNTLGKFRADIGVLTHPAIIKDPLAGVKIIGWITREEFKDKYEIIDFGYGKTYCLPQKKLHKIETLKKYIEGSINGMDKS